MRIPAVAMPCVRKIMILVFPPGKDSPCYSVLKDKPPAQLLPSCAGL